MASILKRTAVLSFSRFANQAIVLLSPMLLVRLLTVTEYGSYREFMLFATLIGPLISFGIARALPFLIPKYPEKEQVWLTQTAIYVLFSSVTAIIALHYGGNLIRAKTSFDFVILLQLYLFFFINLDFVELYWLGKKRTDYVLYYSSGRLILRTAVVVVAAYAFRDARSIIVCLVFLEAFRCLCVLIFALYRRWFSRALTSDSMRLQASYFLPLGSGAVIETANNNAGMLFISTMIGTEALAFYAIGTFAGRIVDILRGAIADVIFPDIVELKTATPREALPLWQQATVWYCVMLFPIAALFSYYADAIVILLFTQDYASAVPVFAILTGLLVLSCFDFHLPLRVQNANRYFFAGSSIALLVNLSLLYPMFSLFGLIGPALGFVISRIMYAIYMASRTMHVYEVELGELVLWRDIGWIFLATVICMPILVLGKLLLDNLFMRAVLFGGGFLLTYLLMLRWIGVWDAFRMAAELLRLRKSNQGTTDGAK
jgi:O-antigen/teichoic acid export membrane protein